MEKKYLIFIFLLFFKLMKLSGQIIRPGLISAQATLSTSTFFNIPTSAFYLHGGLDAFLQKKVSFYGDFFWYLGEMNKNRYFDYHHSVFYGLKYHLIKENHDIELGILPGISITQINQSKIQQIQENQNHIGINPQISVLLGYNYFIHRFFHFFVQARYLAGIHTTNQKTSLQEFRFSAGLGFNLNILK